MNASAVYYSCAQSEVTVVMIITVVEASIASCAEDLHEDVTGGSAGRRQAVGRGSPFTRQEAGNAEDALLGTRLVDSSLSISKACCTPRRPGALSMLCRSSPLVKQTPSHLACTLDI
ncbi:hypothetical protein E4T39_03255 [Aureobasidium subglaciale]|nr:hypothetical protein E4T39_03255 [Aureobasidium subglaciale]